MAVSVLVGVQWGDEGKGKIIDVLTRNAEMVVRFQGGNNAGHTVETENKKFVLHLVPSGVLRKDTACVIGNGVVVDPVELVKEMKGLQAQDVDISNIQLSSRCHLIMPWHKLLDAYNENKASKEKKIGTTKRGIGPAYAAKANRVGIRACDMLKMDRFEALFREQAAEYNKVFTPFGAELLDVDAAWQDVKAAAEWLLPYVKDTVVTVNQAAKAGKTVLLEGAQGAFLDIDHGTYPFVTSS
ncbi:MAG: adenylosuccinate synthetase, partial [Lentisphaeria bacterium]|nr:adenylosuccinate synthetase [Lentisphaeria bacterium]